MSGSVDIAADAGRNLLKIVGRGFFSIADVERLAVERAAACSQLSGRPNDHVSIVDVSECKIQSREVVLAITSLIRDPEYQPRRVAFVTGPLSLARMQLRRTLNGATRIRMFEDHASAEAWIFDEP